MPERPPRGCPLRIGQRTRRRMRSTCRTPTGRPIPGPCSTGPRPEGPDSGVRSVYDKWSAFGAGSFVQSAMGNHEEAAPMPDVTPLAVHCAFSNLPGNERTYAFTWGNTFFVTLD